MTTSIWIFLDKVYEEVMMRSWWRGEAAKTQDPDAAILQASEESHDELKVFATTALNQIVMWATETMGFADLKQFDDARVPFFWVDLSQDCPCDSDLFAEGEMAQLVFPSFSRPGYDQVMRRAIYDYVIQYAIYKWALSVRPDLASEYALQIEEYKEMLHQAMRLAAGNRPRRKYRTMNI